MNELDILELEHKLLKSYISTENMKLFNIYKNHEKHNILNTLMIWMPIGCIEMGYINHLYPFYGIAALSLLTGLKHMKSIQKIKINQEIREDIIEHIKTTDTYKKLENEYLSYISVLANFIKEIGMTSGIEVAIFYNFLLDLGYLSKNHFHQYEYIKPKKEEQMLRYEIPELLGSRVVTGESVCRHMASMLTDLENEIGNKAINIPVKQTTNINRDSKQKIIFTNHLTSIIQDHKTKLVFGYCPTHRQILQVGTNNYQVMLENNIVKYLSYNILDIITNHKMIGYNSRYLKHLETIFCGNLKEERDIKLYIPTKEPYKAINIINSYLLENQKELYEFYKSTKGQLQQIDSLLTGLYPQEYNNRGKVIKYTIK